MAKILDNFAKLRVDLFDLARNSRSGSQNSKQISGNTVISQFERLLLDLPPQPSSTVTWSISGYCNSLDQSFISVSVQAHVTVVCQRCLDSMVLDIDSDNQFIIFKTSDQVRAYDDTATEDDLEPLLVDNTNFDVLELIEDELILNLPFTPKHDDCVADVPEDADITINGGLADQPSPFAILSKLKKN